MTFKRGKENFIYSCDDHVPVPEVTKKEVGETD
jgi:hypothetical protein